MQMYEGREVLNCNMWLLTCNPLSQRVLFYVAIPVLALTCICLIITPSLLPAARPLLPLPVYYNTFPSAFSLTCTPSSYMAPNYNTFPSAFSLTCTPPSCMTPYYNTFPSAFSPTCTPSSCMKPYYNTFSSAFSQT